MHLSRQDVRLAIRSFARHPGFAFVAVLSLALAIALNTTMYSVLDAMVNPKLDMRDPDRLFALHLWGDNNRKVDDIKRAELIRSGFGTYEAVTYSGGLTRRATVELGKNYAQVGAMTVAPDMFAVLGSHPVSGRVFAADDMAAANPPVVISERLATTLSPSEKFPVGSSIFINGVQRPVIGVVSRGSVPPGFFRPDVFVLPTVPLKSLVPNLFRLRSGKMIDQAVAEFGVLSTRVAIAAGEDPKYVRFDISPLNKRPFQPQRFHFALIAAVIAVLLVACANLANLQLARGIGRSREMALRTALGASRRDIVLQLLLESALIAAAGLVLGVLLTFWGVHVLDSRVPPAVAEYVIAPQISWRLFAFAMLTGSVCVLLIGLYPALRVSRVDPNVLLKSGAGTGANKKNRQQYGVMVAAQIGFSLALLSGAALVVRTALRVRAVNVGYDYKPLSSATLYLQNPQVGRDTFFRVAAYSNELLSRFRSIPDVAEAAIVMGRSAPGGAVTVDERGGTPHEITAPMYSYKVVSPSFFRTYRIPIVKGRDFVDGFPSEPEVIVDQRTARSLWPGVDPIGMQIKLGEYKSNAPWVRVVGVVGEVENLRQLVMYSATQWSARIGAIYYLPTARDSFVVGSTSYTAVSVTVRAKSDPERMPITLQRYFDRGGPVKFAGAESMESELGILGERVRHNFVASVFLTFAALAVGLAALGIYGIVAHSVAERRRELGVRLALGASARDIMHAVLREGNAIALIGVAVGLLFTKFTVGWLHAFILEEDEYNAPVFAAMGLILFTVAVLSALWPALRATRIDPVESLRSE